MARRATPTRGRTNEARRAPKDEFDQESEDRLDQFVSASSGAVGTLAQARLSVGRVDDPAEVEADQVAAAFTGGAHRHASEGSAAGGSMAEGGFEVGGDTKAAIKGAQGGGSALPEELRGELEGFFGTGLGHVRVHADGQAAGLSRSLGAEAFTVGSDVFFGGGRFDPESDGGRDLIAHEVTHVVQQGGGASLSRRRSTDVAEQTKNGTLDSDDVSAELGFANDTAGASTANYDFNPSADSGPSPFGTANVTEIANATKGLWDAIHEVIRNFNEPTTTKEKVVAGLSAVKAASDAAKTTLNAVGAASGSLSTAAAGAIPGLGVVVSTISLADSLFNKLMPLWTSKNAEEKVLENARGRLEAETNPEKQKKLQMDVTAYETVLSTTKRRIAQVITDMVGDATMIVGQVATLASGPFGVAVTAIGGVVKIGAAVVGKVWDWVASHRAAAAIDAGETAQMERDAAKDEADRLLAEYVATRNNDNATHDDLLAASIAHTEARQELVRKEEALDKAKLQILSTDAHSAFMRILDIAFEPIRQRPPQEMPADVRANLIAHGITEQWIQATEQTIRADKDAAINHGTAVDMAAKMIAVGPPMSIGERVAAWGKSVGAFFKRIGAWFASTFGSAPAPVVTQDWVEGEFTELISHSVVPYARKKESQGDSGVKQEKVNKFLDSDWKSFVNRVMAGAADDDDRSRRMVYLDNAVPVVLKAALRGARSNGVVLDADKIRIVELSDKKLRVSLVTA